MFSTCEYVALRNETIERIKLMNSLTSSVIATIISTWTVGVSLLVVLLNNINNDSVITAGLFIMDSFFFIIPILYFWPLSVKCGENISRLASLSVYIKVFFEYKSFDGLSEGPYFNWETTNGLISFSNGINRMQRRVIRHYNDEFFILALISFFLYTISAIIGIVIVNNTGNRILVLVLIVIYIACAILSVYFLTLIYGYSQPQKNMLDKFPEYSRMYVQRAVDLGVYTAEYGKEVLKKLNGFENESRNVSNY